jgi:hypothetical protein
MRTLRANSKEREHAVTLACARRIEIFAPTENVYYLRMPRLLLVAVLLGACDQPAPAASNVDPSAATSASSSAAPTVSASTPSEKGMRVRIAGGDAPPKVELESTPLTLTLGGEPLEVEGAFALTQGGRGVILVLTWTKTSCEELREQGLRGSKAGERRNRQAYFELLEERDGWRVAASWVPNFSQLGGKVQVVSGSAADGATFEARVDAALETSEDPPRKVVIRGDVKAKGCGSMATAKPRKLDAHIEYRGLDLPLQGAILTPKKSGGAVLHVAHGPIDCTSWAHSDIVIDFDLAADGKTVTKVAALGFLPVLVESPPEDRPFRAVVHGPVEGDGMVKVGLDGFVEVGSYRVEAAGTIEAERCPAE